MTLPQIVSLVSTVLLTTVTLIIGIQIIFLLKEIKHTIAKLNQTLDSASETLSKISQPAVGFFAILEGFRQSGKILETVQHLLGRSKPKAPVDVDSYDESL